MVSFWPFKGGDDNSAASFERILSQLSTKINKASAHRDRLRQQQRRYKVLWTLYTTFAYILVAAILTLVTGWHTWSYGEYTAVAGGPVLIYGVRTLLDAYYNYRLANSQNYLNDLNKQRDAAIERLKLATKYNSTQQLLEKYGSSPPAKRQSSPQAKGKRKSDIGRQENSMPSQAGRTGFAPPPTANIPTRQPLPELSTPHEGPNSPPRPSDVFKPSSQASMGPVNIPGSPGEDFAPNAFAAPSRFPPTQLTAEGGKWYDRILDVVLGEDETNARNRIVLICQNCKLVNGQALPGARTLEEVGRWRCSSCHAWNGVESEEKKILQQISQSAESPITPVVAAAADVMSGKDVQEDDDAEEDDDGEDTAPVDVTPAGSTRSKARQRKKA